MSSIDFGVNSLTSDDFNDVPAKCARAFVGPYNRHKNVRSNHVVRRMCKTAARPCENSLYDCARG